MEISFYDFEKLHDPSLKKELSQIFSKIMDDNSFIEGPYNTLFEEKFKTLQEAKHCLLVANGTDAIEMSLKVLGVSEGDYVGVPGITFYATAEAVINIGARPVFIDVNPKTGLLCERSLQRIADEVELKAIVPVHIYGMPANMHLIEAICQKKNIGIVEDAAQAQGTFYLDSKKPVGSRENLTTFSFYPTKNLGCFGDAGAILTPSDNDANLIKSFRNHGRGSNSIVGRNSRCDHMQAAVLHSKLPSIEDQNKKRKAVAKSYFERLHDIKEISLVPEEYLNHSSWHLFPVLLNDPEQKEEFKNHLQKKGIATALFYAKALCDEDALSSYKKSSLGEWENSRFWAKRVICLPINPYLTETQLDYISREIKSFFKNIRAKNLAPNKKANSPQVSIS